jgi:hypothetical protein
VKSRKSRVFAARIAVPIAALALVKMAKVETRSAVRIRMSRL